MPSPALPTEARPAGPLLGGVRISQARSRAFLLAGSLPPAEGRLLAELIKEQFLFLHTPLLERQSEKRKPPHRQSHSPACGGREPVPGPPPTAGCRGFRGCRGCISGATSVRAEQPPRWAQSQGTGSPPRVSLQAPQPFSCNLFGVATYENSSIY